MSLLDRNAASRYGSGHRVRFAKPALRIIPAALSRVDGKFVVCGGVGRGGYCGCGTGGGDGCCGLGGEREGGCARVDACAVENVED